MSQVERHPMTPEEFDAKCRELRRLCPWLSETSGARSKARNAAVGGKEPAVLDLDGDGIISIADLNLRTQRCAGQPIRG